MNISRKMINCVDKVVINKKRIYRNDTNLNTTLRLKFKNCRGKNDIIRDINW